MPMLKSITLSTLLLLVLFAASPCEAAESPQALKTQADNDIRVASTIMTEAVNLLKGTVGRDQVASAINLYARAGQLYEKAANTYKAIGPNYASAEDVQNASNATQLCVNTIQELKRRLSQ